MKDDETYSFSDETSFFEMYGSDNQQQLWDQHTRAPKYVS